ncbi:hypothetical protein diail_10142, partial [Diaporthe ilicicola]
LTEWQLYAQKIEGDSWVGEKLDPGKVEKMSGALLRDLQWAPRFDLWCFTDLAITDQQVGQLYELMQAIKKRREEGDPGDAAP